MVCADWGSAAEAIGVFVGALVGGFGVILVVAYFLSLPLLGIVHGIMETAYRIKRHKAINDVLGFVAFRIFVDKPEKD